jgi:hypothetical protein
VRRTGPCIRSAGGIAALPASSPFPDVEIGFGSPGAVDVDGSKLLFDGNDQVRVLPPGASAWQTISLPVPGAYPVIPLDHAVAVRSGFDYAIVSRAGE